MKNRYTVIVSQYSAGVGIVFGETVRESKVDYRMDEGMFVRDYKWLIREGVSVVIRPEFNDSASGESVRFHEWRSFDGSPFKRVDF